MPTRQEVYAAIDTERAYQTLIEQNPNRSTGEQKKVGEYIVMLHSYLGKATDGWTDAAGDDVALENIRKIAGICVKCMEEHGAPLRISPLQAKRKKKIGIVMNPKTGKAEVYNSKGKLIGYQG